MLSVASVKEIVITLFFVGDFGWVRHLGVAEDNRGVAFLVFLYLEKGIFFHILSYIFTIKCQTPVKKRKGAGQVEHCKCCRIGQVFNFVLWQSIILQRLI